MMQYISKIIFILLLIPSICLAADPPKMLEYKKKVISGLAVSLGYINTMYQQRFVELTIPKSGTINKTAVYYDAPKVLREFYELVNDRTGLTTEEIALVDQIPTAIEQAKSITAQRYILAGGGAGYQAFPHGLSQSYTEDGDAEALAGLIALRQLGNWVNIREPQLAREHIGYVRDVIYSLQIGIMATKYGITETPTYYTNQQLMDYYKGLSLSHLTQWHTGNFFYWASITPKDYRSSFMVGLCATGLIEYYERIQQDPLIPVKIKPVLDDLWEQNWYPDVTNPSPQTLGDTASYAGMQPAGAFWGWSDWVIDHYVVAPNHNTGFYTQDVAFTHLMMIAPAYAWYALYSGDASYMDKASKMFEGSALNMSTYNPEGQLWEGMRYAHEFIRFYRKFYNTPCSSVDIEQCSQSECSGAGGNWSGEWCRHQPVSVVTLTGLTSSVPSEDVCDSSHLSLCTTETPCTGAGGHWYNSTCNASQQPTSNGSNFGHSGTLSITPAVTGGTSIGVTSAP